jgi:DNA-binding Xre family transcriptional regulator
MNLCDEIRKIQRKKKVTNKEISKVLGITPVNYSKKINHNLMKGTDIEKICDYLNIEITIKDRTDIN